jgi:hypothetical protein
VRSVFENSLKRQVSLTSGDPEMLETCQALSGGKKNPVMIGFSDVPGVFMLVSH